ncbi:MAG: ABC transporter substrate-binding protein [Paracoccaceae bacterium]|nr:ABC transporter substrate-binding protein [Paracoccaceae bacterium]|tara:strand:+ start:166 stop:1224 length:1059 start_codon:yes stop_codon:yes gene_type:complete
MKKQERRLSLAAGLVASSLAASAPAFAEGEVVFSSWGGSFQDTLRATLLDPAAEALNITVKEDTTNGIQDVRAQINAGAVAWDVTEQELSTCETLKQEGSLEPLDYSLIDTTGIPPELINSHYVGLLAFTKVIAYRKDVFGDNGPSNWAEFWDLEKFPGKRGMHGKVNYNLEAALMADGVPAAEVYATLATDDGIKRAWSKLAEIAPEVTVWYRGGAQSAQLLRDGEVDMIHMGQNHVGYIKKDGIGVNFTFDGATMDIDCLLVPKGAPNKDNAMRLISQMIDAEAQARLVKAMPFGPANSDAFKTGILSEVEAAKLPTFPENFAPQLLVDPKFYIGQLGELTEEFDTLIQQ